jgi:hypothetical protein
MATLRRALQVKEPVSVPAGTDDTTRLACWMLTAIQPWPEAVREVMDGLLAAHREAQADGAVWRRLRRAAVTLGDDADVEVQAYGQVAEAAAWPLATAQAGLVEMMQAICQLRARQASTASGWTPEDEQAAHAILGRIADGDGMTRPARRYQGCHRRGGSVAERACPDSCARPRHLTGDRGHATLRRSGGRHAQIRSHRPELCRPCGRIQSADPRRAGRLQQMGQLPAGA